MLLVVDFEDVNIRSKVEGSMFMKRKIETEQVGKTGKLLR